MLGFGRSALEVRFYKADPSLRQDDWIWVSYVVMDEVKTFGPVILGAMYKSNVVKTFGLDGSYLRSKATPIYY